jgi:hypothetical protein
MSLARLPLTLQITLAWRQGDTAASYEAGLTSPKNPYHPTEAATSHEAWRRGFTGHPMDERGGFYEPEIEGASAR